MTAAPADDLEGACEALAPAKGSDAALRTPAEQARFLHLTLARAAGFWILGRADLGTRVFLAAVGAEHVADEALGVAHGKGSLAEMGARLDAMPDDADQEEYDTLAGALDREGYAVYEAVLAGTLERYGLREAARLYEDERASFELLREEGRRRLFRK